MDGQIFLLVIAARMMAYALDPELIENKRFVFTEFPTLGKYM